MLSGYKVVLQLNKTLSACDLPEGMVVSIQRMGDGIAHILLNGERADAEHALRGLKESICFFQRIEIEQIGPRMPVLRVNSAESTTERRTGKMSSGSPTLSNDQRSGR